MPLQPNPLVPEQAEAYPPTCGGFVCAPRGVLQRGMLLLLALLLLCGQLQLHAHAQRAQRADGQRWASPLCFAAATTGARTTGSQGRLRLSHGSASAADLPTGHARTVSEGAGSDGSGSPKAWSAGAVCLTLPEEAIEDAALAAAQPRNELLRSECARRGMRTSGRHPPM